MTDDSYVEQFNQEGNGYIGCSAEELDEREKMFLSILEMDKQNLKKLQQKIKREEQELSYVREARKYLSNITTENFLYVEKMEKSKYIGNPAKIYGYSSTDFKKYVVYKFSVYQANAKDNTKARTLKLQSGDYTFDMKSNLMKDILESIKKNNIKKVYLAEDVKIAEKQLEKAGVTIIK